MALVLTCPSCGQGLTLPDEHRGFPVICPQCRTTFPAVPPGTAAGPHRPAQDTHTVVVCPECRHSFRMLNAKLAYGLICPSCFASFRVRARESAEPTVSPGEAR